VVVAAVGGQPLGTSARTAERSANVGHGVEERDQLGDVVAVAARERPGEPGFPRFDEQVVFGAVSGSINRARACLGALFSPERGSSRRSPPATRTRRPRASAPTGQREAPPTPRPLPLVQAPPAGVIGLGWRGRAPPRCQSRCPRACRASSGVPFRIAAPSGSTGPCSPQESEWPSPDSSCSISLRTDRSSPRPARFDRRATMSTSRFTGRGQRGLIGDDGDDSRSGSRRSSAARVRT
jgi:hypothetical protein